MNYNDLLLQGLPALKLLRQQTLLHLNTLNSVHQADSKSLSFVVENGEHLTVTNLYKSEDVPEISAMLEQWCNRLAGEKMMIEQAITELENRETLQAIFN